MRKDTHTSALLLSHVRRNKEESEVRVEVCVCVSLSLQPLVVEGGEEANKSLSAVACWLAGGEGACGCV